MNNIYAYEAGIEGWSGVFHLTEKVAPSSKSFDK